MENKVEESVVMYGQQLPSGYKNLIRQIAKQLNGQDEEEMPIPMLKIQLLDEKLIDDEAFLHLLGNENPLLSIESEEKKVLILSYMPNHEKNQRGLSELFGELFMWNKQYNNKLGVLYESHSTVEFPDGSLKDPDITYILRSELSKMKDIGYITVIPTLVVEWFSTYDVLKEAQEKMQYYMNQGVRLAWLIVPQQKLTYVYRPDTPIRTINFSEMLTGEDILADFEIKIEDLVS